MKQIKSVKRILTNKIRDNSTLAKYSSKEKAKELLKSNEYLRIELESLRSIKKF